MSQSVSFLRVSTLQDSGPWGAGALEEDSIEISFFSFTLTRVTSNLHLTPLATGRHVAVHIPEHVEDPGREDLWQTLLPKEHLLLYLLLLFGGRGWPPAL